MGENTESELTIWGAVVAGLIASLCCLGPLLFAMLGLGAFGLAGIFAAARPYLLVLAVLLLAFGFYRAYFRREQACEPGEACATKRTSHIGRVRLWIASVAVLAFALSPYYAGRIAAALVKNPSAPAIRPTASATNEVATAATETVTIHVEGMDCVACEAPIRAALQQTPGVRNADVSYKRGDARVEFDPTQTSLEQIKLNINSTGYKAR